MSRCTLALCLSLVLAGCGRRQTEAPPPNQSATEPVPPASDAAPAEPVSEPAPPLVAEETDTAAVLSELTQRVRKFAVEQRRVPKSLEEVVAGGYLDHVPQAPAGKKFVVNPTLQVQLVDR